MDPGPLDVALALGLTHRHGFLMFGVSVFFFFFLFFFWGEEGGAGALHCIAILHIDVSQPWGVLFYIPILF